MKAREEASKGQINSGFCAFRRIQENERGGCKQFVFRTLTLPDRNPETQSREHNQGREHITKIENIESGKRTYQGREYETKEKA